MVQYRRRQGVLASSSVVSIGIDVHKESWHVTALVAGEVVFRGRIPGTYDALRQLLDRFVDCEIRVAYEAGPCGFSLYDQLDNDHIHCVVAAPSLIPVESGNRVKTDRRDSFKLADLLEAGKLKGVFVLSEEERAHRRHSSSRGSSTRIYSVNPQAPSARSPL